MQEREGVGVGMTARRNSLCVRTVTWSLVIVGALAGCRSIIDPVDSDGLPLVRRPMWWGFYQRALVHQQRQEWQKAAEDLERAIGRRPGAVLVDDNDRERAKTYGVNFIDDYFPRRELGICYYHLGKLGQAEVELNASLRMAPSDRAWRYVAGIRNK